MRDPHHGWLLPSLLLCACTNTVEPEHSGILDDTHCAPRATRSCPCLAGGVGSQVCDEAGDRYGACIGCNGAGADVEDVDSTSDQLGVGPGIACGIAFPVLCGAERETCCARSLSLDSCIPSTEACGCGSLGCVATAVRCDGPEDCPNGQACCGSPLIEGDDAGGYTSFACAPQCAATQHVACHAGRTACPDGLSCANSQVLTNMQVCIDPASLAQ